MYLEDFLYEGRLNRLELVSIERYVCGKCYSRGEYEDDSCRGDKLGVAVHHLP